jgi:glycosyltransferase involved in cell wall biosynthesis
MQQNPLVTIICMCYNHQDFVLESLYSVMNQSYENIEIIIVDDCSNDNSKSIIEKWLIDHPNIKFIANTENLGNTKSFNNAAKLAKGEFLVDLATDDILLPNCVDLQLRTFENSIYKNLVIVYGNCEIISENGTHLSHYFNINEHKKVIIPRVTGNIYLSVLSGGDSICSVSAMIKKNIFDELNGYDENLAYEDLDFWIRASRKYNFDFVDEILVQKRILSNSLSSNFIKKNSSINFSAYEILKKAISLNQNKKEDLAVQKRVHFWILKSVELKDFRLLTKHIYLKMILSFRILFKDYKKSI